MRIAFFAPPKPIDHKVPSGDLIIGRELHNFLCSKGHEINIASHMRMRHITTSPNRWPSLLLEYNKTLHRIKEFKPDIWLTYHSYYKSPDLFGPYISQKLKIPYVIYQGVFATKYRRNHKTWLGYIANKNALIHADHVFANKDIDFKNLSRIILPEKLSRTFPGINISDFPFCKNSRKEIRSTLDLKGCTCVMSTAMLRDDVKAESMADLIKAFAEVVIKEPGARLIIAGDGPARGRLEYLAKTQAGNKIIFLGKIKRDKLYKYYSAADLFAFPGINEAFGMVYLEAQSAGLPIVAYSTRGPSETVKNQKTGLLSPQGNIQKLSENILKLTRSKTLRDQMKAEALTHIKKNFDLKSNLLKVESELLKTANRRFI